MAQEYTQLLNTYKRMYGMIDAFHFNSQNTADVYGKYIDIPADSKVISITHGSIQDHRKKREYNNEVLRLGFIGSEAPFKGLPLLKSVIAQLNQEGLGNKILLNVYGGRSGQDEYSYNIYYKGRFTNSMMAQVYDDMDLLVVPSICNETFSFATLEALSYGTVVLVSSTVGAKDIVKKYSPEFIFNDGAELLERLRGLITNKTLLYDYQNRLLMDKWCYSMEDHAEEIVKKIYK